MGIEGEVLSDCCGVLLRFFGGVDGCVVVNYNIFLVIFNCCCFIIIISCCLGTVREMENEPLHTEFTFRAFRGNDM